MEGNSEYLEPALNMMSIIIEKKKKLQNTATQKLRLDRGK